MFTGAPLRSRNGIGVRRRAKTYTKLFLQKIFTLGQYCGVDILPRHFYSNIPDIHELNRSDRWKSARSMTGISGLEMSSQEEFAASVCGPFTNRLPSLKVHGTACEQARESGYGPVEADFLLCFIASIKPKRVVQIGCGVSTAVMLRAAALAEYKIQITCIDPYPSPFLMDLSKRGEIILLAVEAQGAPDNVWRSLAAGDLLFVDSTHAVKVGSEVNDLILEVIPSLATGVFIHFHDIYFPYDYSRDTTSTVFFPLESVLLHAFLIGNEAYRLLGSLSMLHYFKRRELQLLVPSYTPAEDCWGLDVGGHGHFPSSVYIKKVKSLA